VRDIRHQPSFPDAPIADRDWLPIIVFTAAAFGLAGAVLHLVGRVLP
jgi:hypothetical protein